MAEQVGWQGMLDRLKAEAPRYTHVLPQLPRLVHRALAVHSEPDHTNNELLRTLIDEQQRTNRLLSFIVYFAGAFIIGAVGLRAYMHWRGVM